MASLLFLFLCSLAPREPPSVSNLITMIVCLTRLIGGLRRTPCGRGPFLHVKDEPVVVLLPESTGQVHVAALVRDTVRIRLGGMGHEAWPQATHGGRWILGRKRRIVDDAGHRMTVLLLLPHVHRERECRWHAEERWKGDTEINIPPSQEGGRETGLFYPPPPPCLRY